MVSPRATLVLSLLFPAVWLLASCSSSSSKTTKLPKNLPKISVNSSPAPPPHRMSRGEYPFDSRGNYVSSWAAEGDRQRRSGGYTQDSRSDYTDWQESHHSTPTSTPQPTVAMATPEPEKKNSFFRRRSTSPTPAPAPVPAPPPLPTASSSGPVMVLSSTGGGSSRATPPTRVSSTPAPAPKPSVASTTPKPAPKPAAKPTPKPAPKPTSVSHTVKSGDTLYGLALRYKSTVAKIKSANGLSSDLIRPGQKLRIPR